MSRGVRPYVLVRAKVRGVSRISSRFRVFDRIRLSRRSLCLTGSIIFAGRLIAAKHGSHSDSPAVRRSWSIAHVRKSRSTWNSLSSSTERLYFFPVRLQISESQEPPDEILSSSYYARQIPQLTGKTEHLLRCRSTPATRPVIYQCRIYRLCVCACVFLALLKFRACVS